MIGRKMQEKRAKNVFLRAEEWKQNFRNRLTELGGTCYN